MTSAWQTIVNKVPTELQGTLLDWFKWDQDTESRNEVVKLCVTGQIDELNSRFSKRVVFGTAGLRARMEPGTDRLNSLVILQSSQGLATYIANQFPQNKVAVVGHDHRFHSKQFAMITASIFLRKGFKVFYLNPGDSFVHTPMVPFTVEKLNASVGVMITASHNPKMDNGYKVYYNNGCQIIPPHNINIATLIDRNLEPWSKDWNWIQTFIKYKDLGQLIIVKDKMTEEYIGATQTKLLKGTCNLSNGDEKPWFVYTPMHGVGFECFEKIAQDLLNLHEGKDYLCVPEQRLPDPSFSTVSFPNPEEKGALDKAIELAESNDINLVLANDPDADRFSVAIKSIDSNQWKQLTGNEIGYLFACYELYKYQQFDDDFKRTHPLAMLNSTVSSKLIAHMAIKEQFHYEETLTGFKWIGNRAKDLIKEGYYVPFGFEEAIGYMFTELECDKDGIAASVNFLKAYSHWKNDEDKYPDQILKQSSKYGIFKEYNGYYIVEDPNMLERIFNYIRYEYSTGNKYPDNIGTEFKISSFRDLTTGYDSTTENNIPILPVDPHSQMITIKAKLNSSNIVGEHVTFTMRGSGTEPKLKIYIEASSNSNENAQSLAKLTWDVLKREWFKPDDTGLTTTF